ncbi:MAG: hypothetical protein V2A74_06045 [bacterium]
MRSESGLKWLGAGVVVLAMVFGGLAIQWRTSHPLEPAVVAVTSHPAEARPASQKQHEAPLPNQPLVTPTVEPPTSFQIPESPKQTNAVMSVPESDHEESVTDPLKDDIADVIEAKGGVFPAYVEADAEGREDLIDYLVSEDTLRKELAQLLLSETDSELRAYMLERVDPEGYFDAPDDAGGEEGAEDREPKVDEELKTVLDAAPLSEMGVAEWLARLDLALQVDDAYAVEWARKALREGPDDPHVRLLASSLVVSLSQSVGGLETEQLASAVENLFENIRSSDVESGERIRGYYALFMSSDQGRARHFLEEQLTREISAEEREVINSLLTQMAH